MAENKGPVALKKRRLQGACDQCRSKKIRCDSARMPDNICTNCIAFAARCTHLAANFNKAKKAATVVPNDDAVQEAMQTSLIADQLNVLDAEQQKRYYGEASNIMFLKSALDTKRSYTQQNRHNIYKRPQFWSIHPWQWLPEEPSHSFVFPDDDLLPHLIELYFANLNTFIPILHRPSFERALAEGQHLKDRQLGQVLLAVCACASRYSNDPRIFSGAPTKSDQSRGWKWFTQIRPVASSFIAPPTVYELQLYAICVLYLQGSSTPEPCWALIGLGIRFAQDVGAHRKETLASRSPFDRELWKRAFWALISFDIYISTVLGRPRATTADDYNQDYPIACDDEYWDGTEPFIQPAGVPSTLVAWVHFLKLLHIASRAQKVLYAVRTPDLELDVRPPDYETQVLIKVNAALEAWLNDIPEHLRWDPNHKNQVFLDQSTMLYTQYYSTQILIHRPFITSPGPRPSPSPSLNISTTAARACVQIMHIQSQRGFLPLPNVMWALFNAGLVLLIGVWEGSGAGAKDLADVYKCLSILSIYETRWQTAGRLCDMLQEIISAGEQNSSESSKSLSSSKRTWDPDSDSDPGLSHSPDPDLGDLDVTLDPMHLRRVSMEMELGTGQHYDKFPAPAPEYGQPSTSWMGTYEMQSQHHLNAHAGPSVPRTRAEGMYRRLSPLEDGLYLPHGHRQPGETQLPTGVGIQWPEPGPMQGNMPPYDPQQ